jgi:hypothetical protein
MHLVRCVSKQLDVALIANETKIYHSVFNNALTAINNFKIK